MISLTDRREYYIYKSNYSESRRNRGRNSVFSSHSLDKLWKVYGYSEKNTGNKQ